VPFLLFDINIRVSVIVNTGSMVIGLAKLTSKLQYLTRTGGIKAGRKPEMDGCYLQYSPESTDQNMNAELG
jgi:hypothetical protein